MRPSLIAWSFLLTAPALVLVGVTLLLRGHWGGAPCLLVAAFNTYRSGRIIVAWRRARSASDRAAAPVATFTRDDVAWAPGSASSGMRLHRGWVVLRPGWVAFLPEHPPTHAGVVAARILLRVGHLGGFTYDLSGALAEGLDVFDRAVLDVATANGQVWQHTDGQVAPWREGHRFLFETKESLISDGAFPRALLSAWPTQAAELDARRAAVAVGVVSLVPTLIGAVSGAIALTHGASTRDLFVGVGSWWLLAASVWVAYFVVRRTWGRRVTARVSRP